MVLASPGFLLPGPFCAWLEAEIARYGKKDVATSLHTSSKLLDRQLGVENGAIGLLEVGTVDALLTQAGASIHELYGPMYNMPIPETKTQTCGKRCRRCKTLLRKPASLCGLCIEEDLDVAA